MLIIYLFILLFNIDLAAEPMDSSAVGRLNLYLKESLNYFNKDTTFQNSEPIKIPLDNMEQEEMWFKKIQQIDSTIYIEPGEGYLYTLSYQIDSVKIINDYALGYVTIDAIANEYMLDNIYLKRNKTKQKYILFKVNGKWLIGGSSGDIILSPESYIKWADEILKNNYIKDSKSRLNVKNNLRRFKRYLKENR